MSVNQDFFDAHSFSTIQSGVAELTGLSFSVFDSNGMRVSIPEGDDRLISRIKSSMAGREEYERFMRDGIEKTVLRREASLLQGPAFQYHLFIPINVNGSKLVSVSSPFYLNKEDFQEFVTGKGRRLGLTDMDECSGEVDFKDHLFVRKVSGCVKSMFETVLSGNYEKNLLRRKYQWTKTLIDVLFNLQLPVSTEEFHSLMMDSIIFLFNVSTVAVMVKDGGRFSTRTVSGFLKDEVSSFSLEGTDQMVVKSIENCFPSATNDIYDLSKLRLPNSINSIHAFPLMSKDWVYGFLVIYNTNITREESNGIMEFCKLICLMLKNLSLYSTYEKSFKDIQLLNSSLNRMTPYLSDTNRLYDSIVDTASQLSKAERCSLMLNEEGDMLQIKAVRGINKNLTREIRLRSGEGIAGRVFAEGTPLMVQDIEKEDIVRSRQKGLYKTRSFISLPITFSMERIGVLNVSDKATGEEFTEEDLNIISHFASYASFALKLSRSKLEAERMKELSITDPLTGLFNRRYLIESFNEEIYRSERFGFTFSLAMLDIDSFKLLNDTEGHLAGDEVLKSLAVVIKDCLRAHDIFARFGGEEFAILMPQTDKKEAFIVSERIRKAVRDSLMYRWEKYPKPGVTVSIGICSYPDNGKTVNDLIKNADLALYRAKETGKDKTVIFKAWE